MICETDYCGSRCRRGKCDHPKAWVSLTTGVTDSMVIWRGWM